MFNCKTYIKNNKDIISTLYLKKKEKDHLTQSKHKERNNKV